MRMAETGRTKQLENSLIDRADATYGAVLRLLRSYSHLGSRTLTRGMVGTQLIGRIPWRGSEAYLHVIYSPAQQQWIEDLEKSVAPLPDDFRLFLQKSNGLYLFAGQLAVHGWRRDYSRIGDESWQPVSLALVNSRFEKPKNATPEQFYIGFYEFDGSRLYIDRSTSRVFRCARRDATPLNEWPDFWGMLQDETTRLSHLFNSQGEFIELECPTTPPDDENE